MIRKYSKKGLDKRKEERKDLPEFFEKHTEISKKSFCEECGQKLNGNISEIAHILPKNYFKSIMTNDLNVIYLCGMYSKNNCHTNYDNWPLDKVKDMKIFPKVKERFVTLQEEITEKINYKILERYE